MAHFGLLERNVLYIPGLISDNKVFLSSKAAQMLFAQ